MTLIANDVTILESRGQGRPTVVIAERGFYEDDARHLFERLTVNCRVVLALTSPVTDENWGELGAKLLRECESHGLKQVTAIGFGGSASLVQHLALVDQRRIRRLVLIDASTRPHPSWHTRLSDWLERYSPLGLPLRLRSSGFDSKSMLHRIRCPVLVAISARCDAFRAGQSLILADCLPTAWLLRLSSEPSALVDAVNDFHDVAAKCPQKGASIPSPHTRTLQKGGGVSSAL